MSGSKKVFSYSYILKTITLFNQHKFKRFCRHELINVYIVKDAQNFNSTTTLRSAVSLRIAQYYTTPYESKNSYTVCKFSKR